ncbi:transposase [Streptomyces sp. NPDC059221]
MRKGRIYGTVLVDVETGRSVDLLPDREESTVTARLAECPEVEVTCRHRAPFFAEGASTGAPTAVQVADRFHLWRNLGEATERCVSPSHLSASAIHGSWLRGCHRTTGSRSRRVTVADWTPLRRSNPRETRHRARNARRRTQSAGGRPRTPDDLPNRSAPGRRSKPEGTLPRTVAEPQNEARQLQAVLARAVGWGLHECLDSLEGDPEPRKRRWIRCRPGLPSSLSGRRAEGTADIAHDRGRVDPRPP